MRRTTLAVAMAMLPALARLGGAQVRVLSDTAFDRRSLPRDVAREAASMFNATAAIRSSGRLVIEEGRRVNGDVAVINGPLIVSGHIAGRVVALNSDVILHSSARIDGDLLVVGGDVEGRDVADIAGEIRIYHQPLHYRQDGDRIVAERDTIPSEVEPWWRRMERRRADRSWSDLHVATAGAYNRVEGLPINLGPQLNRHYDWGSTRLDGYAILRTASSFSGGEDSDVGHNVRAEVRIGRFDGFALGGRLFNVVDGVETWQLSDLEVGLASFFAHRDYRDYFQRRGGSASMSLFALRDVSLTGSFSNERWTLRNTRDPFTLFRNQVEWRLNPAMDEGPMHVANGTLAIDTRNDARNPWSGWYIVADWERGVGSLAQPTVTAVSTGGTQIEFTPATHVDYSRGFLDLRRYNRLSPEAQLNLRIVAGGWLNGDPLPMQRRLSVDGPGAMPGFGFREIEPGTDVGTCNIGATFPGMPALCDRIALGQVEYRGDLHVDFNPNDVFSGSESAPVAGDGARRERTRYFHSSATWVLFADAGRGWLVNAPPGPLTYKRDVIPPLSTFRSDIGAGFEFGEVGVYLAKAISSNEPVRFFLRLRHRF